MLGHSDKSHSVLVQGVRLSNSTPTTGFTAKGSLLLVMLSPIGLNCIAPTPLALRPLSLGFCHVSTRQCRTLRQSTRTSSASQQQAVITDANKEPGIHARLPGTVQLPCLPPADFDFRALTRASTLAYTAQHHPELLDLAEQGEQQRAYHPYESAGSLPRDFERVCITSCGHGLSCDR